MAITKIRSSVQLYVDNNLDLNSKKITNLAEPTLATDAATKGYVDAMSVGLDIKSSVVCRSVSSSGWTTAVYNNGTNGIGATITISSGAYAMFDAAFVLNDRVLIAEGADLKNGIYVITATSAANGGTVTLTRSTDFDAPSKITSGAFTFIETGTLYADSGWVLKTDGAVVVGTTALEFVQFSGAGQITPGAGLTKTGNTIDVIGTTNRITVNADSIDIASTYIGQTSITTLGTISTGAWQGSVVSPTYGGTGVNNGTKTITLGGNFTHTGAHTLGLTTTGNTSVTLPTTGTLATLIGTETLQNKTINLTNNSLSGTFAQFNTALSDDDFVGVTATQTLTNKTLTAPNVTGLQIRDSSIVFEGSLDDTFETTLTVANPTADVTVTIPAITGTLITTGDTGTVTNTMLAGSIANAKLANSTITINGSAIALGGSISGLAVTSGTLAQFAATTSAQLAGVISDETGSGSLVFANTPTLVTPKVNTITGVNATDAVSLYVATTGGISLGGTSSTLNLAVGNGSTINIGGAGSSTTITGTTVLLSGATDSLLYLNADKEIVTVGPYQGVQVTGAVATWSTPDTFSVNQTATYISNLQVWLNGMLLTVTDDYTYSFGSNIISVNLNDSFGATAADKVVFAYIYK